MRYTVRTAGEGYGGFRVVVADPEEALRTAHDLAGRGLATVEIVDEGGEALSPVEFGRRVAGHGLSADQLDLIQSTCDVLLSANMQAADLFYDRLFELAPETRTLFGADLGGQKRKLLDTLASLIGQISHPGMFIPLVSGLGRRHLAYGARPEHYGPVGEALLHSLAVLLGARFTPDVRAAWAALYGEVATAMLSAGETRAKARPGPTA